MTQTTNQLIREFSRVLGTCYVAAHPQDAEWMVGETVRCSSHAFRTTGYDLADIRNFAAAQNLKVLAILKDGTLGPVVGA